MVFLESFSPLCLPELELKPFSNFFLSVTGNWIEWTAWSACSASCGVDANKTRTRECNNPAPAHGGQACMTLNGTYGMNENEYNNCNLSCCPGWYIKLIMNL